MTAAMSLRIALVLILVPVVAASSGGDAFSNSLFSGISPLLALVGQDFANHFLSQSTSWLDSIIFATGPLGIPAAITAAIRVGGYSFLKGLIGQAGERESSVEKDLLSSTSREVCELWDGRKVVRLEATDPFIQELIYVGADGIDGEEWYNLREAIDAKILVKKKIYGDEESQLEPGSKASPVPPNILLNLIADSRSWVQRFGAIFGIILQTAVLIVAGLTTFYPYWKRRFSVQLYEFCCMAGGTGLLTFGLIICASVVDQRTQEETYTTKNGKPVSVVWLQRGRSDTETDQSFNPCIFGVERNKIRTSRLSTEGPSGSLKVWTLVGTLAASLGFILQFIGLIGMHWPTQVAQFTITLIMTVVRAFIRRTPQPPHFYSTINDTPNTISDKHEMDWLASKPKETSFIDLKNNIEPWQLMTAGSLSDAQGEGNKHKEIEEQQFVLDRRYRLGTLCEWTGMARKWAVSLATAIDGVMNILSMDPDQGNEFTWVLDFKAGKSIQNISFTVKRPRENDPWKSNLARLEAALSLGLFGDKFLEEQLYKEEPNAPHDEELKKGKEDWLRWEENMERKAPSIKLLGPKTPVALRNLMWWVGPRNRKLKEVSLPKGGVEKAEIEQYQPLGFLNLESTKEADLLVKRHRIAGFRDTVGNSESEQQSVNSSKQLYLAAISDADPGLLYAQHMFSAFMQAIAKKEVNKFSKATIENKWNFIPSHEDSWNFIQLSEKTIEKLALCVQSAGLGDIEDAYLSIIAPLSKEAKLPSLEDVFELARESAIKEQSLENWDNAYTMYRLLLETFITSSKPDEMTVKATALLTEFFRVLYRNLEKDRAVTLDEEEDYKNIRMQLKMKNIYETIKKNLRTADGDVLNHLADLYAMQGWPEVRTEFPVNHRENVLELETLQLFLKQNPFHYAAMGEDQEHWYRYLGLKGLNEFRARTDFFGRTALHYVAWKRETTNSRRSGDLIRSLRKVLDDSDCYGMTALHAAAESGNAEIIGLLVEQGASKDKLFQNRSALHIAAEIGHVEVVRKLIDLRADIGMKTLRGRNALHLAALGGHKDVVTELLGEVGADTVDGMGRQALHLAATKGHIDVMSELLEKGAALGAMDINGRTALHLAARFGIEKVVSFLLEKGAALGAVDAAGMTALHHAVENGNRVVVRILLEKNAVYSTDMMGIETLRCATMHHYRAIVGDLLQALLKKRAAVDVTDTRRSAALRWAKEGDWHEWIVEMVLELLQEAVKLGKAPDSAALEPGKEAVCVLLYALLVNEGTCVIDTDTSGRTVQPTAAEPELTYDAEVREIVRIIEGLLNESADPKCSSGGPR